MSVEITCIYQLFTTGSLVRFLEVMIPHFPVTDQLCVMLFRNYLSRLVTDVF